MSACNCKPFFAITAIQHRIDVQSLTMRACLQDTSIARMPICTACGLRITVSYRCHTFESASARFVSSNLHTFGAQTCAAPVIRARYCNRGSILSLISMTLFVNIECLCSRECLPTLLRMSDLPQHSLKSLSILRISTRATCHLVDAM